MIVITNPLLYKFCMIMDEHHLNPLLYKLCIITDEQLQLGMHIDLIFLVMNMCFRMKDKVQSYFKMARTNIIPKLT